MKRFRLTLAFVVASVIAIGAAFLIVNKAVDDLAERNVERIAEQDTFQDVMHVQAMIDDSLEETGMPVDRLAFPTLDEAAFFLAAITPGLVSGLGVERLDLLDLDGTILWSTDETMAGADKRDNPLFEKGAAGEIASRTVRGYELVDLAGFRRQTDVVEIYLPLRHQGSGQMIGVLTVFRDVGEELAAHLAASRDTLRWTTGTFLDFKPGKSDEPTVPPEDFLGKTLADVLPPGLAQRLTSTAELVLDTGETQSIELGLPRANEMRDFEARIVVVGGSEVLAIVRDIMERKEMEQRIRRLADENAAIASIGRIIGSGLDIQDVYERFAEHVRGLIPFDRIVITVRGADPGVLVAPYVSGIEVPAWVRGARMKLQGSVEDEALRTRSVCVFQPESADEVRERFPEEMSGFEAGVVSTLVAPLISGDQAIGCLGFSSMKHHAYGEAEERLARIVADQIAGAVANGQLYAELKQAEEAVRDSETRLRDLFEEAPVGYHEIDPNGRITGVNRTEGEMLGYATDEMVGRSIFDFIEESDLARREFAGAKARQRKDDLVRERSFVRKDGSLLPVLVKIRILKDDSGEVTGARVTVQDIADRKRAEEALTKQAQDLARSNAELEQFAYVASHDLQEPLRMVKSYTQLLAKRYVGKLDADADEFIGYAADAATRMGVLISDLLTYSRVGRSGKEFEPVNCEQVLDQVLLNLQTGVEESGAQVTRDPMPTIVADGSQLTQLFQNLIGNAIKYRGEAAPEIHVGSRRANGEWSLYVRDNGMGIDPKHAERIFAIFQRLHTRAEYPGTGIGLALCKKIVERHGGRIWLESEPGKGATFRVTLPDREEVSA